jgi:DNA transposition AAA+ family ATPase
MVRQESDNVTDRLRADVRSFLASRPDLGNPDLAAHSTLADHTVRSFVNGNIPGGHSVVSELRRVLDLAQAGDILQPGARNGAAVVVNDTTPERVRRVRKAGNFYQTQTVRRVAEVMDFCSEQCAIGVITADFGVGKSEAVAAWRKANAGKTDSLVLEFDQFSSRNIIDFICLLGAFFGVDRAGGSANGGKLFRDLCERLRKSPCLLIFDQAERVSLRILDLIRQIWDHTRDAGVGVVLLSAPVLLTRMTESRIADLGALTSRVGIWAPLAGVQRGEMAAIVKQEGFTDIEESAFDLWWKATGGSMRRLMRALDLLKAKHAGKRITEKTIAGVAGHLWGMVLSEGAA